MIIGLSVGEQVFELDAASCGSLPQTASYVDPLGQRFTVPIHQFVNAFAADRDVSPEMAVFLIKGCILEEYSLQLEEGMFE